MRDPSTAIAEVADRVSHRSEASREWFAEWSAEFHAASEDGDEDRCALLIDVLVAFDLWQGSRARIVRRARV